MSLARSLPMQMLPVQGTHFENHSCETRREPRGGRSSVLWGGSGKPSLGTEHLTWPRRVNGGPPTHPHHRALQMQSKFRCGEQQACVTWVGAWGGWGFLRACPGARQGATAKFGLHPLGTGFLIRRVMEFPLPNCVLIVHSLKIKRH